jgi:hypothetical protein
VKLREFFCRIERNHLMTMFSMKPKFNLAEFLAVPAPAGARSRGGKGRGMRFPATVKPEEENEVVLPETKS